MVLLFLVTAVLGFYTVQEYRPKDREKLLAQSGKEKLSFEKTISILTYNIGYGGLDESQDFFMDGGTGVNPQSQSQVMTNLDGIMETLKENDSDIFFIQEVDKSSKRSFYIDEINQLEDNLEKKAMYAPNYRCIYVPFPLPTIGKIDSGIITMSDYYVHQASRLSLPESFSWPVKTANLKRCILETRLPIEGSDKELVLFNFHLEAYDSGEGKIKQTKMLSELLMKEYEKGNYVVAGGDFNQTFAREDRFRVLDRDNWQPGKISEDDLPEHFGLVYDNTYPTCRLLNKPYTHDYKTSQVYVIDGFIVSDNIDVSHIETINTDFKYTDHHPVQLKIELKK